MIHCRRIARYLSKNSIACEGDSISIMLAPNRESSGEALRRTILSVANFRILRDERFSNRNTRDARDSSSRAYPDSWFPDTREGEFNSGCNFAYIENQFAHRVIYRMMLVTRQLNYAAIYSRPWKQRMKESGIRDERAVDNPRFVCETAKIV